MRTTYRVLAYLIALGVVVQAAAIAFAFAGLGKWVAEGGVLDAATMESGTADFTGVAGFIVHGMNGGMVIPVLAVALLVVSFFAKVPRGVRWAAAVFVLVAVQATLGYAHVPELAMLHGVNALVLFSVAALAARAARAVAAPVPAAPVGSASVA